MAQFELNIYGKNDEIINTFETDKVRWGVYMEAVKLEENGLKDKTHAEQFKLINGVVKKIFPELTDADLENADGDDVMNTFNQLLRKGNGIGDGANSKNATGAAK